MAAAQGTLLILRRLIGFDIKQNDKFLMSPVEKRIEIEIYLMWE